MPSIARADVIGSLLRPKALIEARAAWKAGTLSDAEVRAAEDGAIREAVATQEACGLDVVTDGEFRRSNFIATVGVRSADDATLDGFQTIEADHNWLRLWRLPDGTDGGLIKGLKGAQSIVVDKIRPRKDVVANELPFVKGLATTARVKVTFPAPSWHRANWHPDHSKGAYPKATDFLLAMRDHTRDVVSRLIAGGCDYIHMDAPNYAQWHIDPSIRDVFQSWGRDLDAELIEDAEIDNSVFDGISGVTRGIHLCRGNAPGGRWLASGGYEAIAERLFPRLTNYDTLLLEYDTARAGSFEPLAHARADHVVVLGLVTTKDGRLEDPAAIEGRIREAARIVPLERLALSPQCGFASGEYATTMTHAEQAAKLRLVGTLARKLWPAAA